MAEPSNNILGLRAQIIGASLFIITLLSSTGDQWSARAMDGNELIAGGEICSTPELALQSLLDETSKMIWTKVMPMYEPY
ncbi:unnamed protein product [Aureobasidium mustum]|uniref:Uncharacterized protein n=1 Tax=Aureobasidium mustum TaxID=2773714 RepID=A0A9N8K7A8_9PEZI|nr:unnamed protein product [Aureobasidium mustum]